MSVKLSVLMITKNAAETLEKSLASVKKIADEIIIVDSKSTDRTVEIAKNYLARVYIKKFYSVGKQRMYGLARATGKWILILDADEIVSEKLMKEIKSKINNPSLKISGYFVPFQNFYFDKPLKFGGENYRKYILFKRNSAIIKSPFVHEHFISLKNNTGTLKGKIYHHSYRSITQILLKFTDLSMRMAKDKFTNGEKSSFKKIFLYPVHMFWARFILDKGYEDGLFRIPLDLGFAYMEFITYFALAIMSFPRKRESRKSGSPSSRG